MLLDRPSNGGSRMSERRRAPRSEVMETLRHAARQAQRRAYAPYSRFPVGAAVLARNGQTYTGCNVENASYGLTVCAERNAIFHAVAAGAKEIDVIVVVAGKSDPAPPCGACRQVIFEFGPRALVEGVSADGMSVRWYAHKLLPHAFGPSSLKP